MHFHLRRPRHPRGLTVVHVVIIVAVVGFIVFVLGAVFLAAIMLPALGKARKAAQQIKDGTQVRGIHQAMVIWAGSNRELYPLPSRLDRQGATVAPGAPTNPKPGSAADAADPQRAKDTTANIFSIMIFNNMLTPEIMVSPAEPNANIVQMLNYNFTRPTKAVSPQNAQWDPAFSADFTAGKSNVSYAHMQPSGLLVSPDPEIKGAPSGRMVQWRDTYDGTTAILGTRFPQVASVNPSSPTTTTPTFVNPNSLSTRFFGRGGGWGGNTVFSDNHVNFDVIHSGRPHQAERQYLTAAGKQVADCNHFDESDDLTQSNVFLGIFTTAGEKPADFKPIWD